MIRTAMLSALVFVSLAAGCRQVSDGASDSREGDPSAAERRTTSAAVESFLNMYVRAIADRDTATLREMYAEPDRFVWIEDGVVRYGSASEVFQSLAQFGPDTPIETELEDPGVARLAGGGVHTWASFTTTMGEGGGGYSFGGLMSFVLEPADGGNGWRIVGGHVSSPRSRGE